MKWLNMSWKQLFFNLLIFVPFCVIYMILYTPIVIIFEISHRMIIWEKNISIPIVNMYEKIMKALK